MPCRNLSKVARIAARHARPKTVHQTVPGSSMRRQFSSPMLIHGSRITSVHACRAFSTTRTIYKGISPETDNPQPKEAEAHTGTAHPAELSVEQYHELADQTMDVIVEKLEQLQEEQENIDVEYSAGVLTLTFPPNGTYIINKQPPNKQIWLSSPISGPKRYDFVLLNEDQNSKEGTGAGDWIYLRDGSSLTSLLLNEVGVDVSIPYAPVPHLGE